MDVEERLASDKSRPALTLAWWHVVLIASAVVVALSSVVVAYAELRQADELRKANCADRSRLGGNQAGSTDPAEDEFRDCLGI